jgi:hypothetical protein
LKKLTSFTSVSRYSLSIGTAEVHFSKMKAQKFTSSKIVNIHGTQPFSVCVCVCRHVCYCKTFPGSVSFRYSVPNNASQECFLEVSNFGFCSTLLFRRSTLINYLRRKCSALNMPSVCLAIMMHVSTCIISLLDMISIQVITSGTVFGGLDFSSSLALSC